MRHCFSLWLQVPFAACLEKWAAPELLEGVDGGPGGTKRTMVKQNRFATFPPFLLIQMRRCDWLPRLGERLNLYAVFYAYPYEVSCPDIWRFAHLVYESLRDTSCAIKGHTCIAPYTEAKHEVVKPIYTCVAVGRYYTGEGWVPKKMDVLVEAPDELSLEHLRSTGLQPGAQCRHRV